MKALFLTQVLPYPPDSGPKVKTWNVLKYLAQQHEVTLVSFVRGEQAQESQALKRVCRAVYTVPMERGAARDALAMARSWATGQPWMMVRDDRAAMRQLIDRLALEQRFDVAHADQLNMAQYAAQYAARVPGARTVLDAHNALWLLYQRLAETMRPGPKKWLLERDWRLLKGYEGRVCREFDAVTAVSQEDKVALQEAMGDPSPFPPDTVRRPPLPLPSLGEEEGDGGEGEGITVIPIAVDTDEFPLVARRPDADNILHIGTMYWPPNIDGVWWFIREVLPRIRAQRPDSVFDVVGARPPEALAALDTRTTGVNVTGYVADAQPYLEQAGVMVVPVRAGGGMRVKILNALSQGLPIVTTTMGCEGIAVQPDRDVLIADTPDEFARATLRLLGDRALADELGRHGRELIRSAYDYRAACRPLDEVYAPSPRTV